MIELAIYRFNPEVDQEPRMQTFHLEDEKEHIVMLLDALKVAKRQDESLSFRRSCSEGVCGSDGMNINGRNGLACVTPVQSLSQPIVIRPLPGLPVIRDLIVDLTPFYEQYEKVKPFLQPPGPLPAKEQLQSPEERDKIDGLYECILCACCTSACPSYWWNPDKFLGPAALLQATRFIKDSRDGAKQERLAQLEDAYSAFRCRSIMNCVEVCPKGLNPTKAIGEIRDELLDDGI